MRQSKHYKAVIAKVQQFVKAKELLKPGSTVIVGVSGGIDSVVLLDILSSVRKQWGLTLVVAHLNYQLRGKDSDKDKKFVRTLADRYGLEFHCQDADTRSVRKQQKVSIQVAARNIRYTFFETLRDVSNADAVAVGHNANDNAETIVANLFRGTGIDGIAGIPVRRNHIVRPLLCLSRSEIARYAKAAGLRFRTDKSNLKEEYTRNYIRRTILPKVEKRINPSVVETLMNESEVFWGNRDFIESIIEKKIPSIVEYHGSTATVSIEKLKAEHPFIRQMVIRKLLMRAGIEPSFTVLTSVDDLRNHQKGKRVSINKAWVAERLDRTIEVRPLQTTRPFNLVLHSEGSVQTDEFVFSIRKTAIPDNKAHNDTSIEYIDATRLQWPVTVRSWEKGDVFVPLGMNGTKKVSDYFVDVKLPRMKKTLIPIVESNRRIIWVGGQRLDERFKLTPSTTDVYQLSLVYLNGEKNGYH